MNSIFKPYLNWQNSNLATKTFKRCIGTQQPTSSLIKQFISPIKESESIDLKNSSLIQLFKNFNLSNSEYLPLRNPTGLSPFEFHSTYNDDISYILNPRLSVTKLLINRWCELREFYNIYSNSPQFEMTKQIKLGLELHQRLEFDIHKPINMDKLIKIIDRLIVSKGDERTLGLFNGNVLESTYAEEFTEKLINRLFVLLLNSESREILVHGFLNLNQNKLITNLNDLLDEKKVLVSGIIDHLKIINPNDEYDYSLFKEIQDSIEFNYPRLNNVFIIDLSKFLNDLHPILIDHSKNFKLQITDIKTRSFNKIPSQLSVLNSAKLQTFYYRRFFGILSGENTDNLMSYNSLIQNLKIKQCDIDKPINFRTLIILLRKNFSLLYNDFLKLSNGESIGFKPYDDYVQSNYKNVEYDLGKLVNTDDLLLLNENDDEFDYTFISNLLKDWKTPLTLRYFIARSSQFYSLFDVLLSNLTSIEYHNGKTNKCFHVIYYNYDPIELDNEIQSASLFWNGKRDPVPIGDISKCKHCEFNSKCLSPNHKLNYHSIGLKIKEFIQSE